MNWEKNESNQSIGKTIIREMWEIKYWRFDMKLKMVIKYILSRTLKICHNNGSWMYLMLCFWVNVYLPKIKDWLELMNLMQLCSRNWALIGSCLIEFSCELWHLLYRLIQKVSLLVIVRNIRRFQFYRSDDVIVVCVCEHSVFVLCVSNFEKCSLETY